MSAEDFSFRERIRNRFSRAAATYDAACDVQREAVGRLAAMLPPAGAARRVLELGCGTGMLTAQLLAHFSGARLTAVDFSLPMLEQAAARCPGGRVEFVCADGEEYLAGCRQTFDLVASNAALQWFADQSGVFRRIAGLLAEGGRFVFSCFGPATLAELNQAIFAITGQSIAAAGFTDFATMEEWLRAWFRRVEGEVLRCERSHGDVRTLLRSLRDTGTAVAAGRGMILTPHRLVALEDWFQNRNSDCRVSYELYYFRCER